MNYFDENNKLTLFVQGSGRTPSAPSTAATLSCLTTWSPHGNVPLYPSTGRGMNHVYLWSRVSLSSVPTSDNERDQQISAPMETFKIFHQLCHLTITWTVTQTNITMRQGFVSNF